MRLRMLTVFGLSALLAPAVAAADPLLRQNPDVLAGAIDSAIDGALADKKVPASPPADDAEFLRRVSLDLIGRIPTLERTTAFLADADPDKRAKLIDELLASPEYGRNLAILWQRRIGVRSDFVNSAPIELNLYPWLAEQFNRNRPWGEIVSDLLSAEGDVYTQPATNFYLSSANTIDGVVQAERVTGMTAQLFLGVNLRCAQCHDHPFAKWKQSDFWGMTAFFGRVGFTTKATYFKVLQESKDIRNKDDQPIATARPDATIVIPSKVAGKEKVVRARFLDGTEPDLDPERPFRTMLAKWMTSKDNKMFARAAVNRTWAHFFGRGLVDPVDDLNDDNPPSNPELFARLSEEFAASGHDLKRLARAVCLSQTYQRTSRPLAANKDDATLYSHMPLKQLRGDQLADSLFLLISDTTSEKDLIGPMKNPGRGAIVAKFRDAADPTGFSLGVPQMLQRMGGLMAYEKQAVKKIVAAKPTWEQGLDQVYLAVLSRKPAADEVALFTRYRDQNRQLAPDQVYDRVSWTLLNTSEFLFNH